MAKEKTDIKSEEYLEQVKNEARKALELAKVKFKEAENTVDESIHKDPVHAAMIAAGIGAAIGAAVTFAVMHKKKKESDK